MKGLRIIIAGGGIGGITAALCLAQKGYHVSVFEQSSDFVEDGAGIQLSPNCTRVLHHLGLEKALRAKAFLPQGTQFRQWRTGKIISESVLGESVIARYGMPYYHIHRGDLLRILADAAAASPQVTLRTNARVTGFHQHPGGVQLLTDNAKHDGDLLVGADGIRSIIRARLWGEAEPRFTGNIAWRALVPTDRLPEGLIRSVTTAWWGPNKHFVHYYVRSGKLVNCVCVVEKNGWEVESWTSRGDYSELKADFAGWHSDLQHLIDNADKGSLYKWALFDRKPMPQWGQDRATLLGDACHPTLPFMAQGAAMAIEDACVLAECLANGNDIPASLKHYEDLRRARTARVQTGSRRNARTFHLAGAKAWFRNRVVHSASKRTLDKLFQYNALDAANQ